MDFDVTLCLRVEHCGTDMLCLCYAINDKACACYDDVST